MSMTIKYPLCFNVDFSCKKNIVGKALNTRWVKKKFPKYVMPSISYKKFHFKIFEPYISALAILE